MYEVHPQAILNEYILLSLDINGFLMYPYPSYVEKVNFLLNVLNVFE